MLNLIKLTCSMQVHTYTTWHGLVLSVSMCISTVTLFHHVAIYRLALHYISENFVANCADDGSYTSRWLSFCIQWASDVVSAFYGSTSNNMQALHSKFSVAPMSAIWTSQNSTEYSHPISHFTQTQKEEKLPGHYNSTVTMCLYIHPPATLLCYDCVLVNIVYDSLG